MRMRMLVLLLLAALAVLAVVAVGCGGDEETTTTTAAESTETTTGGGVDGAEVFATNCSGCHGSEGKGATGPDLTPLTDADVDKVTNQVTNGGTVMPALGDKLTTEQIDAVAIYVIGLE